MTLPIDLLATILSPENLTALYQPVYETGPTPRVHLLECLTRGPRGTNIESASVLFEYARRKCQETALDRLCVLNALAVTPSLPPTACLAINVHAATLERDPEFPRFVANAAATWGLELSRLTLEIVEHAPAWGGDSLLGALKPLRERGVRIALDDLGAGRATFRLMLEVLPDYLKVDRFLVQGASGDFRRRAVLESLVLLAGKLGSRVIAEGVECEADLTAVRDLGIELVQGYLLGMPISVAELPGLWQRPA